MKNYVRFLLALGQRAPVSDTPSNSLSTRAVDDIGCYALDTTDAQTSEFNTPGWCSSECEDQGHTVFAVRGQSCMCLDSMPSDDKKKDASECDVACPGYPSEICGGAERGYYSVQEIGLYTNNSTNTSSADGDSFTYSGTIGTATATATYTTLPTYSREPASSTSSAAGSAATPSGSASGSSASPSSTVESTNAAGPAFGASLTVVSSLVGAVALLAALI